jgi:hypothetical protein
MKKLTGALVLSLSLLMTSACRSAGETRDSEDASTPATDAQAAPTTGGTPQTEPQGLQRDAGSKDDAGTGSASPDQHLGVSPRGPTDTGAQAGKASAGSSYAATLSPSEKQAQENCIDKWLKGKKMDRYGHDEGTMYAGGSPIFNEMTGEARERLDYVYERQPDAKKACATATQSIPEKKKGIPEKTK